MKKRWSPFTDGIRQSDLQKWMICRDRFRIYKLMGLIEKQTFDEKRDYGTFIHEGIATYIQTKGTKRKRTKKAVDALRSYRDFCNSLYGNDPNIEKAYYTAIMHMSQYTEIYSLEKRKYTFVEKPFKIPLKVDKNTVYLTGTMDYGVQSNFKVSGKQLILGDHKVKGRYEEMAVQDQLYEDLQLMIYAIAHKEVLGKYPDRFEYDVIRRPGSHQNSPRKRKNESVTDLIDRTLQWMKSKQEEHYLRVLVKVNKRSIDQFKHDILTPMLRDFISWYKEVTGDNQYYKHNWRRPLGVYDPMTEIGKVAYYKYITCGDTSNLCSVERYPEYEKGKYA